MLMYIVVTIAVLTISILSYYACAWYGLKSSGLNKLPPHYTHLRQNLKKASKQQETHEDTAEEAIH